MDSFSVSRRKRQLFAHQWRGPSFPVLLRGTAPLHILPSNPGCRGALRTECFTSFCPCHCSHCPHFRPNPKARIKCLLKLLLVPETHWVQVSSTALRKVLSCSFPCRWRATFKDIYFITLLCIFDLDGCTKCT